MLPPEMLSGGNKKDCIRVRNLPVDCSIEQILEFLGVHSQHIVCLHSHADRNISLVVYRSHKACIWSTMLMYVCEGSLEELRGMFGFFQGQPSGEAFIQMNSEGASYNAATHKNNKYIFLNGKKRYIEVLQCSGEDMNHILLGLIPSNLIPTNLQRQPMYSSHRGTNRSIRAASCTFSFSCSEPDAFVNDAHVSSNICSILESDQCFSSIGSIVKFRFDEWSPSECDLLSSTSVLLSNWTCISVDLCTDWTSASRPDGTCFTRFVRLFLSMPMPLFVL